MVPIAHASDGGGSIRIPASFNGVFGFKPGPGRVKETGPDMTRGLLIDHAVSWSVRDSALLLSLTERDDGPLPRLGFIDGPSTQRLRIGVYDETLMGDEPTAANAEALRATVALCRELGHEVIATDPPPMDGPALSDAFFTLAAAGIAQVAAMMEPVLGRALGADDLEPFTLELLAWFRSLPEDALPNALRTFEIQGAAMQRYLESFDATLCPTVPVDLYALGTLAPTLERRELLRRTEKLAGYTPIHNIAHVPAMSVPLHTTDEGWPAGSHFAAPKGREATLLALAYELEAAAPWRDRLCA
jgi:amidase